MMERVFARSIFPALCTAAVLGGCGTPQAAPPPAPPRVELPPGSAVAPVRTPEEEIATFRLRDGYRVELVAAEPFVEDPVRIDFDPDGRMYVVEMRGYMPNLMGIGEREPIGRVVVLEDVNDDGLMDRRTVFLDSLVLPRAIKVLEHGVLIGAPPYLFLARDTDGDLRADTTEIVRDDFGNPASNPEHNANGFIWGIDNWIHGADYGGQLRLRDGRFEFRATPPDGQWGVSMDEYGRIYRNSNEDPLRADLVSAHYAMRNPNQARIRGVYERLTPNVPVWPIRKTPAVNRGYRPQTLRPDSTLAHYTAANSPTAYVGDRLPDELRSSVFVLEPTGNLIGRFIVSENASGIPTARRAEERTEFLASTDERFRPVTMTTAPDGTLYFADMYRGIIQHRVFITGYLEQHIINRGLEKPIGLGRIYRIVHESTPRGEKPRMSKRSPAQLVRYLSHPNGWWRITAQQRIVELGDRSVAPALRRLVRGSDDDRVRLHALWTLDGLGVADSATLGAALADASPHVRGAAIRISEPWLAQPGHPWHARLLRLVDDTEPVVRQQLAASLGYLPLAAREPALAAVVARHGDDPVVADLVVSGLQGRELEFLEHLIAGRQGPERPLVVQSLAAAVLRSRDAAGVQRLLQIAADGSRPRWERLAVLSGLAAGAPGGGGAGARLELATAPAGLDAAVASPDTAIARRAEAVAASLSWPGKPQPVRATPPLTPEEQQRFAAGQQQYLASCAGCHQASGAGMAGLARSLVGSPWVVGSPANLIRIVLHGKEGEMLMPPIGGTLTDEQVAAVLTYIRRSWGNEAAAVTPLAVREVRGATAGRTRPWTEAELR